MKRFTMISSAFAFAVGGAAVTVIAQDDAPDMAAMMEMMQQAGAPDEHHALLEPMVGAFLVEGVVHMGPEPTRWTGTATNEWVFGGRFVRGDFAIPAMLGGPDFFGVSYTGFNKQSGEYESVWMDSVSTSMFIETGWYDAETKSFHFQGEQVDPMTGEKKHSRSVVTILSDDRHTAQMFSVDASGEETLDMEMVYTRKR